MKTKIVTIALIIISFPAPVQAQDLTAYQQENYSYKVYNQLIINLSGIVLKEYLEYLRTIR